MAAPVISSVTVTYPAGQTALAPGEVATIDVVATDADAGQVEVSVVVRDASGATANQAVIVLLGDRLTFEASAASGSVQQDPVTKSRFYFTAP